jgi:arginyl-tRNA synthetase
MPADQARRTAEQIAIAAVRYFMVKFSRTKIIAFDIDEALSFEGESGPYLQYAAVRAGNIFNKLQERDGLTGGRRGIASASCRPTRASPTARRPMPSGTCRSPAGRLDEVAEQAVRTPRAVVLAKYAFGLAQSFNGFYHRFPILSEERRDVRLWRAARPATSVSSSHARSR